MLGIVLLGIFFIYNIVAISLGTHYPKFGKLVFNENSFFGKLNCSIGLMLFGIGMACLIFG